jgi:Alw26I/Eco31I/Esp3I family type II restriction m6 adenine DNA methyltransferase
MQSLYECKVLDPACGSGAFPMGMLQQMVHILGQLDPNNEQWKDMMLNNAISETSEAYRNATDEERAEIVADIERSFNESINRPDYARKLYLIENCIYGVDIQPIAIQISKLRFFISLVVDQKTNNNPVDNFGIRPLPNLEAKFVAANTLIGIDKKAPDLFTSNAVIQKEDEMRDAKHRIFGAKTVKTKRKYKERVTELRDELAKLLEDIGAVGNEEAKQLASWDMFDQNATSPFYDSEWMFNVNNGFDIVIGNPPYGVINKKQNKGESVTVPPQVFKKYKELTKYKPAQGGMLNIFRLFIVQSYYLLKRGGVFSEIFPLAFACDVSAYKLREFVQKECSIISLEAFPERDNPKKRVFENAKISVCILTMLAKANKNCEFDIRINTDRFVDLTINSGQISYSDINRMDSRYLTIPLSSPKDLYVIRNVFIKSRKFSDFGKCNTGEIDMTFCKDAFTKNPNDIKMIRGANLDRYIIKETMSQGETFFLNKNKLNSIKDVSDSLFSESRIVMQGITGVNEKVRLKMTLSQNSFCANSVNYCSFKKESNLFLYLGLFNSKLLNYIFKQFSTNSNVNGYEVDNLPIVTPIPEEIGVIASSIFAAKALDEKADTKNLESKIDILVYHLYGLTFDEVLIVDPNPPFTREEYETARR